MAVLSDFLPKRAERGRESKFTVEKPGKHYLSQVIKVDINDKMDTMLIAGTLNMLC